MSEFERELRDGLRRVEAPEGFAERVLARAAERDGQRKAQGGWWRAVAAAFLLGTLAGGGLMHEQRVHQEREERRQAMETKAQFDEAMRITSRSLEQAGRKLEQATARGEDR